MPLQKQLPVKLAVSLYYLTFTIILYVGNEQYVYEGNTLNKLIENRDSYDPLLKKYCTIGVIEFILVQNNIKFQFIHYTPEYITLVL